MKRLEQGLQHETSQSSYTSKYTNRELTIPCKTYSFDSPSEQEWRAFTWWSIWKKETKFIKLVSFFRKTYRKWTWQQIIKDTAWQGPIAFTIILKSHASKIPKQNPCCLRLPGTFKRSTCLQPCGTRRQTHIFQHDGTNCHHWHVWVWWAELLVDFHETTTEAPM